MNIARFEVTPHQEGWNLWSESNWWVYVLSHEDPLHQPDYIGMTGGLRRRLMQHARVWVGDANAVVFRLESERAARRLEAALLSMFPDTGNFLRPTLSWEERRYFDQLRDKWAAGLLAPCLICGAICEPGEDASDFLMPRTEPDEFCPAWHLSPLESFDLLLSTDPVGMAERHTPEQRQQVGSYMQAALDAMEDSLADSDLR